MKHIGRPALSLALLCLLLSYGGRAPESVEAQPGQQAPSPRPSRNVTVLGQVGGPTRAVAVQDGYAYVGLGRRLVVLDVSDPSRPVAVGQTAPLPDEVAAVTLHGGYAYVAAGPPGLRIFDLSHPAAPVEVAHFLTPWPLGGFAFAGPLAYHAGATDGLRVLDISNPTAPVEIGAYAGGVALSVAVDGPYVYVGYGRSASGLQSAMLQVFDVSDPAHPLPVGVVDVPGASVAIPSAPDPGGYAWDLAVQDGRAYVAWESTQDGRSAARGALRVLDVSDPAHPTEIASQATGTLNAATAVAVSGSRAYIGVGGDLLAYDVADPSAPVRVGLYHTLGDRLGVAVAGGLAFLATGSAGDLRMIDLSVAGDPAEVGVFAALGEARDVAVARRYAYIAGQSGLYAFDVADPANPIPAGSAVAGLSVNAVAVSGAYVYAAGWSPAAQAAYLRVVSAATTPTPGSPGPPGRLAELGTATFPGAAVDVVVAGRYAYVAASHEGLQVVDVADPSRPATVGAAKSGYAVGVAVAGRYVYVADTAIGGGVHVFDVANPAAPVEIGFFSTPSGANGVALDPTGRYAFVAELSRTGGLRVLDVANPATPVPIGFYRNPGNGGVVYGAAAGEGARGGQAFLAGGLSGLRVVDVADPAAPAEAGFLDTPYVVMAVAVAGDVAYVADGASGLWLVRLASAPPAAHPGR